ncbi:MAG: hypothetical protein JWP78_2050 [Mucilaginibacter sp.]|nr:hypothetical protein [Mucilaginibacter sp.]
MYLLHLTTTTTKCSKCSNVVSSYKKTFKKIPELKKWLNWFFSFSRQYGSDKEQVCVFAMQKLPDTFGIRANLPYISRWSPSGKKPDFLIGSINGNQ